MVIITLPIMTYIHITEDFKINIALSDAFLGVLILLVLVDYKKISLKDRFPYWGYFVGLISLMVISNTVAYFRTDIQSASIFTVVNEGIKFVIVTFYFYFGYNSVDLTEDINKILKVWVVTTFAIFTIGSAISFSYYLGGQLSIPLFHMLQARRLTATLTDPNLAAAHINVSFFLTLIFISGAKIQRDKLLGYCTLGVLSISILLTQSRSGLVAFIIALVLYGALKVNKGYRYIPIVILSSVILFFGTLSIDARYFDKSFSESTVQRFEELSQGTGEAKVRSNLSKAAFEMGKDHWILGVGRGNFRSNSKAYFEKIGIDTTANNYEWAYGMKIPHNTYATFLAEMGIGGLILFLWIFYKSIQFKCKNNKDNIIFICLLIAYLIQATAINLENYRGIWLILGLIVSSEGFQTPYKIVETQKNLKFSSKQIIIVCIILLLITLPIYIDAAGRYINPIILQNNTLNEVIDNIKPNEEYIFRYHIQGNTDSERNLSSQIKIYGIDSEKEETLLNEISYWEPTGWGNLLFKTNQNTKEVRIEITSLNGYPTEIREAKIVNKASGIGILLSTDYKYVPNFIKTRLSNGKEVKKELKENVMDYELFTNILISEDLNSDKKLEESQVYFDGKTPINLSKKILFLGAVSEKVDNDHVKIRFRFKALDKIDQDYRLWLHGYVIDPLILEQDRREYRFANWDHQIPVKTVEWKAGQIYEHEYVINANAGHYRVSFGFWDPEETGDKIERLYPSINLGIIEITDQ